MEEMEGFGKLIGLSGGTGGFGIFGFGTLSFGISYLYRLSKTFFRSRILEDPNSFHLNLPHLSQPAL